VEHFPVVVDADIARRAAGGRRHLREEVTRLEVALGDGLVVPVAVRRRPGRFGGLRWVLVCVACGRDVMKLRRIHEAPWLACKRDLVSRYAAKYTAQVNRYRAAPSVVDEERAGCEGGDDGSSL
jgi:hypothetical protein